MKIVKYLKHHKLAVLVLLCLLVLQAYCELSLPAYTSDIVDVGIQNGGIAYATPEQLRPETMEQLQLFMDSETARRTGAAYTQRDGALYLTDKDDLARLSDDFALPEVMLAQLQSSGEVSMEQLQAAVAQGAVTPEQLQQKAREAMESMGQMSDTLMTSAATAFLRQEYEAMGLDLDAIQLHYVERVGARMLGLTVLMVLAAIAVSLIGSRVAAAVGMELREQVFSSVVGFSHAELDRFSTASLITRSTNDIQQVQMVCVLLVRIVLYAPILGIGGIIKVMSTSTGLSWIIAAAVAVLLVIIGILMVVAMPKFKKMQELVDRLNLVSREILTGLPVIRAFHRERHEEARFDRANTDLMKTQLFVNRTMAFMMPAMLFLMNLVTVGIEWFGAKGIDLGQLQVGDMIAFVTYTLQIVMAFMLITMVAIFLPRAEVAAGRIDEILNTKPEIRDPDQPQDARLAQCSGEVEFRDVRFRYPGAEQDVLEHISFTARPGQTTAIIGSTGCGKSTLVSLIPRFYDVTGGSVRIDGVDVRQLSQQKLRSLLGFVPQKGVLFSGTIESNLKFGGTQITDADMEQAARIAQAEEFIGEKDDGYQSAIAQGGSNVSGGQKQRLAIARAIARHPQIYIFDDSFSALDYRTDAALRRALHEQVQDATVIIVAQRISTILHADQIIVLRHGRVEAIGTHEQLMVQSPTYQEIARSQLSASELGEEGA